LDSLGQRPWLQRAVLKKPIFVVRGLGREAIEKDRGNGDGVHCFELGPLFLWVAVLQQLDHFRSIGSVVHCAETGQAMDEDEHLCVALFKDLEAHPVAIEGA
jgi:hypothetical protein